MLRSKRSDSGMEVSSSSSSSTNSQKHIGNSTKGASKVVSYLRKLVLISFVPRAFLAIWPPLQICDSFDVLQGLPSLHPQLLHSCTINTLITPQSASRAQTNNIAVLTRVLLSGFGSGSVNRTKQLVPD